MRKIARQPDRDDLPGADDQPQPGVHGRRPDRRGPAPAPAACASARPGHARSSCWRRWASPTPASALDSTPPAVRRHAPARDDRHGAGVQPGAADRRRADHRAGRDGAGADPRLLRDCSSESASAILLITHDLGVVAEIADRVAVMYAGRDRRERAASRRCSRSRSTPTPRRCCAPSRLGQAPASGCATIPGTVPPLGPGANCRPAARFRERCPLRHADQLPPCQVAPALRRIRRRCQRRLLRERRRDVPGAHGQAATSMTARSPALALLRVECLSKSTAQATRHVKAVNGVSFRSARARRWALVGESGCGKTHARHTMLRLTGHRRQRPVRRRRDLASRQADGMRRSGAVQIVFQDPFSSLNPRMRCGEISRTAGHNGARHDRARESRLGARNAGRSACRREDAASTRTSSPAASASASRSRAPWRWSPSCWSATSRCRRWMSRSSRRS